MKIVFGNTDPLATETDVLVFFVTEEDAFEKRKPSKLYP